MEGTLPTSQPAATLKIKAMEAAASGDRSSHGNTASPSPSTSLHSVRKPPAKPWKKPAALPIPPKIYRVDPRGFRQLVQRLTGATDLAPPRRLQDAAPAPLPLAPRPCAPPPQPPAPPVQPYLHGGVSPSSSSSIPESAFGFSADEAAAVMATAGPREDQVNPVDAHGYQYSQVFSADTLSPSLYSACWTWCNTTPLLSPGSMACLEQSTVL